MQPNQQPQANVVQPQPTPFSPIISRGQMPDGQEIVILQLYTMTGATVLFLPPDAATQLGNELIAHGRSAASGLVLPPGVQLPPPHTNNGHKQ